MKTVILTSWLILSLGASAQQPQPVVAVYAYLRESHPGALPGELADERGNLLPREKQVIPSWMVYVEYRKTSTWEPLGWRIGKTFYATTYEAVTRTPVLFTRPGLFNKTETDSLVPATVNPVLKLTPRDPPTVSNDGEPLKIRIVFRYKGKRKVTREVTVRTLPPLVLQ